MLRVEQLFKKGIKIWITRNRFEGRSDSLYFIFIEHFIHKFKVSLCLWKISLCENKLFTLFIASDVVINPLDITFLYFLISSFSFLTHLSRESFFNLYVLGENIYCLIIFNSVSCLNFNAFFLILRIFY